MIRLNIKKLFTYCVAAAVMSASSAYASQSIEVGFSPDGSSLNVVLNAINSANKELLMAAFNFTSRSISEALMKAKQRGVDVRVIADRKANSNYSAVTYLANHGVHVSLNDNYAYFHNKFIVIDGNSVETGSFNYTKGAAEKNAENVIWLRDYPDVAARYRQEFVRLWKQSKSLQPAY